MKFSHNSIKITKNIFNRRTISYNIALRYLNIVLEENFIGRLYLITIIKVMKNKNPLPINPNGGAIKGVRGQILSYHDDPFLKQPEVCYTSYNDGLVVMQDGIILDVNEYAYIIDKYPNLKQIDEYKDSIILPGFIDAHVHYVQSSMIGSFGDTLLQWLNRYTFPTESNFKDKVFADEVAKIFFKQILEQGTTTANVFATTFVESVDAFFEESERYNTRMICGKVLQDRNLPDSLKDSSAEESIFFAEKLLKKWHKRGRQLYAVVPRFAPTSTDEQMRLAGDLYKKHVANGVYLHTHLNESRDEIEWVAQLYPNNKSYTDVYRSYGMLGDRSIMAHTCLMHEDEWQMLHENDCGCAHCPSSNLFLGSGEFKYWEAKSAQRPIRVGIGTDIGGGTNYSIVRELNEAYKVGMLQTHALPAVQSFYLATRGGAEALHLEHSIGSIMPGYEADMTVLDLHPSEFVKWRMQFAKDIFEKLFVLQTLALNDMNKATYVAGNKVFDRTRTKQFMYANEF